MNNRNDEMAEWLNEPSSTSDDKTLDWFFEYYVLSEQETLTDQEKVKLSALKKSLFGDGAPTNEELSQYHYLFVNAPAQQAGQVVSSSKRGRPSKGSINARANEHELYQALEKWWLKLGKPSRTDFMKKLRALTEDEPNEYRLILHPNVDKAKRSVQHEQNDITFTLGHIQKNILKQFEEKHSA